MSQFKVIERNVIAGVHLLFFGDAACFEKLLKLLQGAGIILLFVEVFAKEEEGFLKFRGVGIVVDNPLQPILRADVILVFDFKFCQHQQGTGMIFAVASIAHKAFQNRLGFRRLVDLSEHACQVDMCLGVMLAIRKSPDERFKLILGLKGAIGLVIEGAGQQIHHIVQLFAVGLLSDDDAALLDGFGIFLHRLRAGHTVGVQWACLRSLEILAGVVHSVG